MLGLMGFMILCSMVFSKSSIDEMKRKKAIRNNKSLVEKIVKNAAKKDNSTSRKNTPNGLKYGMDTSSDEMLSEPGIEGMPSRTNKLGRPQTSYPSPEAPLQASPAAKPGNPGADQYYPPPAMGTTGKRNKPQSLLEHDDLFDDGNGLRLTMRIKNDGTDPKQKKFQNKNIRVSFNGTRAFTSDDAGNTIPLADGYYKLPNSIYKVLILDGHKVADDD